MLGIHQIRYTFRTERSRLAPSAQSRLGPVKNSVPSSLCNCQTRRGGWIDSRCCGAAVVVPLVHPVGIWTDPRSVIFTTKSRSSDPRPEIAAVQRRRWRHNLLVLFNDTPQTKAEKEACLLKGEQKMRISSKRCQRDLSLFLFHLSPVTGRGISEENNAAVNS